MRKGFDSNSNLSLNFTKLCLQSALVKMSATCSSVCMYYKPNGSSLDTISQELVPNVYVFSSIMEHWNLR